MNDISEAGGQASFEHLKRVNEHGAEYWSARDLQALLGYSQWRRFEESIKRAQASCEQSGNPCEYHFAGAGKMILLAKGARREVLDYHLSRFACYLIAQNGDPRKPAIAFAQQYFAVQTRRQELSDAHQGDLERVELRQQTKHEFRALSGAAQEAGVRSHMFGIFHDAGYKGLYGGLGKEEIQRRKGIPAKEQILDRMGSIELAANQFRMTQARDKLRRDRVRGETQAIETHLQVGKEVRTAIERIGGTKPENLGSEEHIRQVEKRLKVAQPILELEEKDALGLKGTEGES